MFGRLAAANDTLVLEAFHRSQAIIEFELDGTIITANENFLSAMGYTLAEIEKMREVGVLAAGVVGAAPVVRQRLAGKEQVEEFAAKALHRLLFGCQRLAPPPACTPTPGCGMSWSGSCLARIWKAEGRRFSLHRLLR